MLSHALVIPCFNEALRLKVSSYLEFIKTHPKVLLCLVDDGSRDNTLEILQSLKSQYPDQVHIIQNVSNLGKAEAVRTGVNSMLARREVNKIGFLDADLSTEFDQYDQMTYYADNHSVLMIFGSRKTDSKHKISYSLFRFWAGRGARIIIKRIVKLRIIDTQCGAKIFSREAAAICFAYPFVTSWLFDVEIFLRLKKYKQGDSIKDHIKEFYLSKWVYKPHSNFKVKEMLSIPIEFIRIISRYRVNPLF